MLHIRNLSLKTEKKTLTHQLNFRISPGQCWVVFGKNGIGKTTLLRTLAGLRKPDSGEILLNGKSLALWDRMSLARQRASLPQNQRDAFSFPVWQAVLAGRHPYHAGKFMETDADRETADFAMRKMDILSLKNQDVRTLSGGERQRVALAAVLAQDTPLLLLDEPAAFLDIARQTDLMRLVGQLCREEKKGIVMVTHDLNLVHEAATHALLMKEEGAWEAGNVPEMMDVEKLAECLGYAVAMLHYKGRSVYIPA